MKRGIVVLSLTLAFATPAQAAPGDARLVQGTLEWPSKLTGEPFVVLRAEDGRWYYAEIKSAKRVDASPLAAGGRVAVLGVEGAKPYELNAIAIGSGDAASLAMALTPSGAPSAGAPAAPPATEAPKPATETAPQKAVTKAVPSPVVTAPAAAPPPPPPPGPPPPPPPASSAPSPTPPAVAPASKPQAATPPTPIAAVHTEPAASAPPAAETPRWSEMQGLVRAVEGNSMVVKTAEGRLVIVDVSAIALAASSIKPGTSITVYGTPGDLRFQAVGLVEPDKRPLARPTAVPPRRSSPSQN